MSPSWEHETRAETIGQVIRIIAEELAIPIRGGGSTTFRREGLDRGLEADKCFYIANEARVRGRKQINLAVDPPPDLCIEVQISRRLAERKEIYADLKVPELWCDDGRQLRVLSLQPTGNYKQSPRSISFPMVPLKQIGQFLAWGGTMDDTTWSRRVRKWIAENLSKS